MNVVYERSHNIRPLKYKHMHRPSTALVFHLILLLSTCSKNCVQAWAFQSSFKAYNARWSLINSRSERTNNYGVSDKNRRCIKLKPTSWRVYISITNLQSMESDSSSSIDELQSLPGEWMSSNHSISNEQERQPTSPNLEIKKVANNPTRRGTHSSPKYQRKSTLKSIYYEPLGSLTPSHLRSLCNSIRHNRMGSSLQSLSMLERILLEIDVWDSQQYPKEDHSSGTTFLKPIHIFSTLTALLNDMRSWKQKQFHNNNRNRANRHTSTSHDEQINAKDVHRLVRVVTTLKRLKNSQNIDPGCYNKDVPSFATMIAAEASRWEVSATDAALLFVDMVENEENETNGWDPRLIGAVLEALARYGRAEDAQSLLGRATGVHIPSVGDKTNNEAPLSESSVMMTTTKRLDPSHAGPCYDALLRSWSRKALLLSQVQPDNSTKKRPAGKGNVYMPNHKSTSAKALAQARHILLNHMPLRSELTITNRTFTAVLYGYSALGMGSESESLLMEVEAFHLSPIFRNSHFVPLSSMAVVSSSLDVACYNTVLHACSQSNDSDDVVRAERLFVAMKEQSYLTITVRNSTVTHNPNNEGFLPLNSFSVIPPRPDFVSYSSMLNCYSKHNRLVEAEKLLVEMCDDTSFRPSVACYLPLIQAFETSIEVDAPQRVLSLIERSELSLVKPSRLLYIAALRCMRQQGCGELAEVILEKFQNTFSYGEGPDVYSHMLVLRAWEKTASKSDRRKASERAEAFFQDMEKRVKASLLPTLDVNAYNVLMNCYGRAGDADKAEQLLADLQLSDQSIRPNSKSYSLVLKALANSCATNAVDRAWKVMYEVGYPSTDLSIEICNSMLKLFAKRGMASEAEEMLNKMDEIVDGKIKQNGPDILSYEAVLEALGRCKDVNTSSRAEALVTRLEVMGELGGTLKPSLLIYNTLLNCYANAGLAGKAERLLNRLNNADSFSFGSTIKAISNSGRSQLVSIARAESLANRHGQSNEVIFSHRLKLCQKWGLGDEAELLLKQMEDEKMNPSVIHFTSALNAWAKSANDDSLRRAELLFEKMEEKFFDLDRAAYHGVLLNYSTRGNSNKSVLLLQRMLGSLNVKPNRATFTMVIDSYARSKSTDAGQKAEELLDQMRELHASGNDEVEPDNVTYASVIRCKQVSKNEQVKDLTTFEKLQLMQDLQLESWPFRKHD